MNIDGVMGDSSHGKRKIEGTSKSPSKKPIGA